MPPFLEQHFFAMKFPDTVSTRNEYLVNHDDDSNLDHGALPMWQSIVHIHNTSGSEIRHHPPHQQGTVGLLGVDG